MQAHGVMRIEIHTITIETGRRQIVPVTGKVEDFIASSGISQGLCTISVPHTSAAITVNENADPSVQSDLLRAFEALVPDVRFEHGEGNSDAHLLATLIGTSVTLPIRDGQLHLGRWQGVWFVELDGPRERTVDLQLMGM